MRKALLAMTAAATVLVLLSGCAPAAPLPTHTTTRTPQTPQATPSATTQAEPGTAPTSAPSPEADQAEPWIITEGGLGTFRLGDNDESELLDAGFATSENGLDCIQLYLYSSGAGRETHQQEFEVIVGTQADRTVYALVRALSVDGNFHEDPRAPHTETGITIGTALSDVRAAYPDLQIATDYGGYREYIIGSNGQYLRFITTGSLSPVEVVTGFRAANYDGETVPGC